MFMTSFGARTSVIGFVVLPELKITPFPLVTRISSLHAAHQFLLSTSPTPPTAGLYNISKTTPFLTAVRTRVCLKKNGRRGPVRGREIICVVSGDGCECFKQAREKVLAVVGCKERMS